MSFDKHVQDHDSIVAIGIQENQRIQLDGWKATGIPCAVAAGRNPIQGGV